MKLSLKSATTWSFIIRNILLSDRHDALLSDFGQSREIDERGLAIQPKQYNKIVAPEFFGNNYCQRTIKFDRKRAFSSGS